MSTPPVTVARDTPLAAIAELMEARRLSGLPVVDEGRLVGIVTRTDVIAALDRAPEPWSSEQPRVTAAAVMSAPVATAAPGESLDGAAWRLVAARVHRLVVTEGERVVGILSARDLLSVLQRRKVLAPISTIMSSPVEAVTVGDRVDDAIRRLVSANVHGLVVVDALAPVGLFTQREALAARRLPPELRAAPVEEAMGFGMICLDAATPISRAAAYAAALAVQRIVVLDGKHTVGIVSPVDLVGVLARAPE